MTSSPSSAGLPALRQDLAHAVEIPLEDEDLAALHRAVKALEHSNLATRLANTLGRQLGNLSKLMPLGLAGAVNFAAERAIRVALRAALRTLGTGQPRDTRRLHKIASAVSGAAGGAFGLASLPVELPLSTVIILRSIADIARREGEDLSDPEAAMACLQVFALGAHDRDEGFTDGGYFAVRSLLARTVSEASRYILAQGMSDEAAPVLVRLVSQISARFGLVVSEKLAAQAVPVIGAAGGAAVNYAFAEHFQNLAFGHFTVRRLERRYGGEVVRAAYDRLLEQQKAAA
jgi:hypothetical protein